MKITIDIDDVTHSLLATLDETGDVNALVISALPSDRLWNG